MNLRRKLKEIRTGLILRQIIGLEIIRNNAEMKGDVKMVETIDERITKKQNQLQELLFPQK